MGKRRVITVSVLEARLRAVNRCAVLAEALERQLITSQIGVSRDFAGAKLLRLGSHFSSGLILSQGGILFAKTEVRCRASRVRLNHLVESSRRLVMLARHGGIVVPSNQKLGTIVGVLPQFERLGVVLAGAP